MEREESGNVLYIWWNVSFMFSLWLVLFCYILNLGINFVSTSFFFRPLPQIVWSKDGKQIQPSDRVTQGHYGKSLIIKHLTFEDEGAYTCESSNGVGSAKTYSINLQVLGMFALHIKI